MGPLQVGPRPAGESRLPPGGGGGVRGQVLGWPWLRPDLNPRGRKEWWPGRTPRLPGQPRPSVFFPFHSVAKEERPTRRMGLQAQTDRYFASETNGLLARGWGHC